MAWHRRTRMAQRRWLAQHRHSIDIHNRYTGAGTAPTAQGRGTHQGGPTRWAGSPDPHTQSPNPYLTPDHRSTRRRSRSDSAPRLPPAPACSARHTLGVGLWFRLRVGIGPGLRFGGGLRLKLRLGLMGNAPAGVHRQDSHVQGGHAGEDTQGRGCRRGHAEEDTQGRGCMRGHAGEDTQGRACKGGYAHVVPVKAERC